MWGRPLACRFEGPPAPRRSGTLRRLAGQRPAPHWQNENCWGQTTRWNRQAILTGGETFSSSDARDAWIERLAGDDGAWHDTRASRHRWIAGDGGIARNGRARLSSGHLPNGLDGH